MADHLPVVDAWRVEEPVCPLLELLDEGSRRDCLEKSRRVVYQITPRFISLWELDSVKEFKECFVDLVEGESHLQSSVPSKSLIFVSALSCLQARWSHPLRH